MNPLMRRRAAELVYQRVMRYETRDIVIFEGVGQVAAVAYFCPLWGS